MTWQTIDTAPKDGTAVLVWRPHRRLGTLPHGVLCARLVFRFDRGEVWETVPRGNRCINPSHWQPLPSPPSEADAGDDITRRGN